MYRALLAVAVISGLLLGQSMCCCAFRSASSSTCGSGGDVPADCCCQGGTPRDDQEPHDCPCKSKRQFVDVSGPVLTQVQSGYALLTWCLDLQDSGLFEDLGQLIGRTEVVAKSPPNVRLDPVALSQLLRC